MRWICDLRQPVLVRFAIDDLLLDGQYAIGSVEVTVISPVSEV